MGNLVNLGFLFTCHKNSGKIFPHFIQDHFSQWTTLLLVHEESLELPTLRELRSNFQEKKHFI